MARAPMLPHGQAPPFTDGDVVSMSRTLRWMVSNLRTPQLATVRADLGDGKYRVDTLVAPNRFIYCKGCGFYVGQQVLIFRPIGGTDLDAETEWAAIASCASDGPPEESGSGSGSGSGESGSDGSGEPSGSGSGGSGSGDPSGSGGSGSGSSGSGDPPPPDGSGSGDPPLPDGDGCGSGSGSGSDGGGGIRPDADLDYGGCCTGSESPGAEINASGELIVPTGEPCGANQCGTQDTKLNLTRDHLCLGAVVPLGQGYWRGPCPITGLTGDPDLVVWCDFSADAGGPPVSANRWKMMLVDPATGCETSFLTTVSAQCNPLQIVGDVGTSECCVGGEIPTKRITVTQ